MTNKKKENMKLANREEKTEKVKNKLEEIILFKKRVVDEEG